MLKFFYTLLTDPFGLPLEWFWEYIILTILGWVVHEIAWAASPGGRFGSLIYWSTKLLTFFGLWAVLYAVSWTESFSLPTGFGSPLPQS